MNCAFIPVRGGSKSIPLKNIKPICGMPLVYWTARATCLCDYIEKVYVSTDSDLIRETVNSFKDGKEQSFFSKLSVISRSPESAEDTASTEFAMLEFADQYDFDNIALVQATSPLLQSDDLNRGFEIFNMNGVDSVLSVVRQKRFHWGIKPDNNAYPINYDPFHRPRRQDFDGYLVENGAFYITSKSNLLKSRNRISGNIRTIEMCEDSFFEIDEPSDWIVIEALMRKNGIVAPQHKTNIKLVLTDCDGCLTDGGMYYSEKGDELKKFNTRDGMGFALLRQKGILTGIITSENVQLNKRRADKLKLDFYVSGCKDKVSAINKICEETGIDIKDVCYIGDDINDIEAIRAVGFGCCPANAQNEVKSIADYVTQVNGGDGVIREITDKFLHH